MAIIAKALGKQPEEEVIETLFLNFSADCYNICTGMVTMRVVREIYTKALNSFNTRAKKIIQQKYPDCLFERFLTLICAYFLFISLLTTNIFLSA